MGERTSNSDQNRPVSSEGATHPAKRAPGQKNTSHHLEDIFFQYKSNPNVDSSRSSVDRQSILSTVGWTIRSETRVQILVHLADGSRSPTNLHRELPVHRTTLRRNLLELDERGLVEERPSKNKYQLSTVGRVYIDVIDELVDTVQRQHRLATYLDEFPRSIPVEIQCPSAYRVTGPETGEPNAPLFRLSSLLSITTSFSLFTPVFDFATVRIITASTGNTDEIEIIVDETAVTARDAGLPSLRDSIEALESGTLLLVTGGPPYGIVLMDNSVVLVTYDGDGRMLSILESTDPELTDWANSKYREQRNLATLCQSNGGR